MSDEVVQLKIGGDSREFCEAARQALNETDRLTSGVGQLKERLKEQTDEMNHVSDSTHKTGQETDALGRILPSVSQLAKGFIGAWAGSEGIATAWRAVRVSPPRWSAASLARSPGAEARDHSPPVA